MKDQEKKVVEKKRETLVGMMQTVCRCLIKLIYLSVHIVVLILKIAFKLIGNIAKLIYKYRRCIITILILSASIAILVPALRLLIYSVTIGFDSDRGWWDLAKTGMQARDAYVASNFFAGWLYNLGTSWETYLLRLIVILTVLGSNLYWVRPIIRFFYKKFKKSTTKGIQHC